MALVLADNLPKDIEKLAEKFGNYANHYKTTETFHILECLLEDLIKYWKKSKNEYDLIALATSDS